MDKAIIFDVDELSSLDFAVLEKLFRRARISSAEQVM